jgi:hypothetical protein
VNLTRIPIFGPRFLAALALAAGPLGAGLVHAQSADIVARLPVRTVAVVEWRGAKALGGEGQQNHVLQLLGDPSLAPLWLEIAADFQKQRQSHAAAPPLSLSDILSLVQNPAAAGIIEVPQAAENSGRSDSASGDKPGAPVATFMVYDATGKADILKKWETATVANGPNAAVVRHFNFAGAPIEERAYKTGATYLAMAGHYFVVSNEKQVIEQLITRFSSSDLPSDSLEARPEYVEVQKFIGSDAAFDYFARMPDLKQWIAASAKEKSPAGLKFIDALHLEKIHALGGSVSFAGEATRIRGAILGNTLPVGPFDFAESSSTSFETLSVAGEAPEFSVSRVNFAALYRLLMSAATTVMPEQQAANLQSVQAMAQAYLGMSVPDALNLFTGELASASAFSDDGSEERTYAATIQKPDAVLHILRAVLGGMTLAEDSFGDATMLDIAYPYRDSATGLKRRKMYYVAVTPQLLLVAPRKAMLRDTLESLSTQTGATAAPSNGVFSDPEYAKMRGLLPARLSGLSADDVARIPWNAVWTQFENRFQQPSNEPTQTPNTQHSPDLSWMKLINPDVIPRHLHMAVSGWWKDTNGVYFDSFIQ